MNQQAPDLVRSIRTLLTTRRDALDQLSAALDTYEEAFTSAPAATRNQAKRNSNKARRPRIQPGTVPDRILEILRDAEGPLNKTALVAQAGASEYIVSLALKELITARRIVAQGATSARRYALL